MNNKTYFILYYIPDQSGVDSTCISLHYPLTSFTVKRVELKLKKMLGAKKVVILTYKEVTE